MQEKYPCYYPGEFAPPTKMHLNTLYWLLNRPEIGHVHVVIGKDNGGPISQEQKARLWEILLKSSFAPQASIIKAKDKGPISEIYSMLEAKSDKPLFIALDEKSARNKKLQKKFDKFPHYGMELIPSQFHKSSQALMQAVQSDDKAAAKQELPDDFSDAQVDEYMSILKSPVTTDEPLEDKSPLLNYKEQYIQKFSDGFWKSVFEPMTEDDYTSIYESGEYADIVFEMKSYGHIYEADISLEDVYDYNKLPIEHKDEYRFVDKTGLEHTVYFLPTNHQLKIYYIDPKTGEESTNKNLQPKYDPKVMNTNASIIINEILPKYDRVDIVPLDNVRYRLFRGILIKYLNKEEWDIKTNVEGAISLRKRDKKITAKEGFYPGNKVGDYKYKGFTPEEEKEVISRIGQALDNKEIPKKSIEYVSFIGDVYDKLVKANPELQHISTSVPGYRDWAFPKHDIVFGAFSGIPPEAIKDYVEVSKGEGGVELTDKGYELEPDIQYIKIKKDKEQ